MKTGEAQKERRGPAFTELLSIFLHLDHRLPVLEASAFLLFATSLLFSSVSGLDETAAFSYMSGSGLSLTGLILVILILKNAASGWGSEYEKGTMQTFLTYPLSRGKVLLARLTSALLIPLCLVTVARFSVIFLIAPSFAMRQFPSLVVGYLTSLTTPLLVAGLVILTVQWAKSGGVPFAVGIVTYFMVLIFTAFLLAIGYNAGRSEIVWVVYFFNPVYAFANYYSNHMFCLFCNYPVPTFIQASELLAANLALSVALIASGAMLFMRRTEA